MLEKRINEGIKTHKSRHPDKLARKALQGFNKLARKALQGFNDENNHSTIRIS